MTSKIKFLFLVVLLFFGWKAIAGKGKSELIFSHKFHVVENELECSSCHAEAESSMKGTDNLMPTMEWCGNCHDVESADDCNICHSDMDNPRNVPRVEDLWPDFSHQMHLEAGGPEIHLGMAARGSIHLVACCCGRIGEIIEPGIVHA